MLLHHHHQFLWRITEPMILFGNCHGRRTAHLSATIKAVRFNSCSVNNVCCCLPCKLVSRPPSRLNDYYPNNNNVYGGRACGYIIEALYNSDVDQNDDSNLKKNETEQQQTSKRIISQSSTPVKAKDVIEESAAKVMKPPRQPRVPIDLSVSSMERNFITPGRAMSDFLLKPEHLDGLRATKRRSPYINQPPITMYWRKDVETKALQVWASMENLMKEILKKELERKCEEQSITTLKRQLRSSRRESLITDQQRDSLQTKSAGGLKGESGRVVLSAVLINSVNCFLKFVAWLYTGSHSMFSECVHSLADTMNQLILAYGIYKSTQRPDHDHPYGYANMKYVSSLISGVGIFCVGTGLSVYHGIVGLIQPTALEPLLVAFLVLGGSVLTEGATFVMAFKSVRKGAKANQQSVFEYVRSGQDPSVNVVLMEDCAALLSIVVTATCMGLTAYFDHHIPDAVGSLLVGAILGAVASFIIQTNVTALLGRSIPQDFLDKINYELESDIMVRAIHDVKGIDMGNSLIRYKAEIDFDGRELTRSYLDHQDLTSMMEEVKLIKSIDEFEAFMLKHSESIIDTLGGEIDRIEVKLRKKFPQIRHCDLEIL